MSLSRVETSKKNHERKKQRRKSRNKIWLVNVSLLAIIVIIISVFYRGDALWSTAKEQLIAFGVMKEKVEGSTTQKETTNSDPVNESVNDPVITPSNDLEVTPDPNESKGEGTSNNTAITEEIDSEQSNESGTVNLAFVGDILQGEYIQSWLDQEGYSYPYQKALFHLATADLTIGNLEMPITLRGVPAEDKTYVFKGKPEGLQGLVDAGIDIVSLANNHTLDQGIEGMLDTMTHLDEYGIKHMGAGKNAEEAYKPVTQEVNGVKLAFFGVSKVLPDTSWKANAYSAGLAEAYDPTAMIEAIKAAENDADLTVLMIHWGKEREAKPEEYQLKLARDFIDAGADLIIGSHPHVLQGFEQYNGKWIAYSLGNFVFASHPKGKQAETGVLGANCTSDGTCEMTFYPMKIINAQPTPIEGKEAEELLDFLEEVSPGSVKIDERGNLTSS